MNERAYTEGWHKLKKKRFIDQLRACSGRFAGKGKKNVGYIGLVGTAKCKGV